MKLSLANIGKLNSASIDIDGITVIAGANDTGKSTLGKALFSIFNGLYNIKNQISSEKINSISRILEKNFDDFNSIVFDFNTKILSSELIEINNAKELTIEDIKDHILQFIYDNNQINFGPINENPLEEASRRIFDMMKISDKDFIKMSLEKKLKEEFSGQINNLYTMQDGYITLNIKGNDIRIALSNNRIMDLSDTVDISNEAVYIDDPFILDDTKLIRYPYFRSPINHRIHLLKKLMLDQQDDDIMNELLVDQKLDNIYQKIMSICDGTIIKNRRFGFLYKKSDSDKILNIANLSTGLKTFAILKILLENNVIQYNGVIILDEPEIHLHPQWQILFAELIVLLHKEFNMHILLNSHSPYFINALEVYSSKYDIAEKCKYYLTENIDGIIDVLDVTSKIEEIYKKLAKPFQDLENESYD